MYIGAIVVAVLVIAFIIGLIKKATKLCVSIVIVGALVAAVGPYVNTIMKNNGVSIDGAQITVQTQEDTKVIDLTDIGELNVSKQEDNSYLVTVSYSDNTQTFVVSEKTAKWLNIGTNIVLSLEKIGENIVYEYIPNVRS